MVAAAAAAEAEQAAKRAMAAWNSAGSSLEASPTRPTKASSAEAAAEVAAELAAAKPEAFAADAVPAWVGAAAASVARRREISSEDWSERGTADAFVEAPPPAPDWVNKAEASAGRRQDSSAWDVRPEFGATPAVAASPPKSLSPAAMMVENANRRIDAHNHELERQASATRRLNFERAGRPPPPPGVEPPARGMTASISRPHIKRKSSSEFVDSPAPSYRCAQTSSACQVSAPAGVGGAVESPALTWGVGAKEDLPQLRPVGARAEPANGDAATPPSPPFWDAAEQLPRDSRDDEDAWAGERSPEAEHALLRARSQERLATRRAEEKALRI